MIFNSFNFIIFLPIVFILFWSISVNFSSYRNILLFISSYFFYSFWDYRFLILLIFSTLLDYYSGKMIYNSKSRNTKKIWFYLSITINLGFLGVFKYYNFFIINFQNALESIGIHSNYSSLSFILPIGISFYTFHGLSYVIDIYKEKIQPEKNFLNYALFVAYFPLLVAGPIERATHLLPQIKKRKYFDYQTALYGMRQILWGLFKKVVIADNCANLVDQVFNFESAANGSSSLIGVLLFSIQIYCDFSGYSDIALGTSRLFGIELIRNFKTPYFSRDIAEFWRRWHISLSTWFKDYVYIPLGGSKSGTFRAIINTFIIFIISGFWHGPNWTFIFWGFLNAIYFLPLMLSKKNRANLGEFECALIPSFGVLFRMLFTFSLVSIGWVFFRSNNIYSAFSIISKIFSSSVFDKSSISPSPILIFFIAFMVLIEWIGKNDDFVLETLPLKLNSFFRSLFYLSLIFCIIWFAGEEKQFIYFQF